ncbi:hypothetical protein BDW67DRAFT_151226 [Aspergillus spinulosporus]
MKQDGSVAPPTELWTLAVASMAGCGSIKPSPAGRRRTHWARGKRTLKSHGQHMDVFRPCRNSIRATGGCGGCEKFPLHLASVSGRKRSEVDHPAIA